MLGFFKKLSSFFELTIPPADKKNISVSPAKNSYQEAYENKEEFEDDLDNSNNDEESDRSSKDKALDIDLPITPSWFVNIKENSEYWIDYLNASYDGYTHSIDKIETNTKRIGFFSVASKPRMYKKIFDLSWPINTSFNPIQHHNFDADGSGLFEVLDTPLDILKKMYIEQFVRKGLGSTKHRFETYKNKEWYEGEALEAWRQYGENDWKYYKAKALKCKKNFQRVHSENHEVLKQAEAQLEKSETCVITLAKLTMNQNKLPYLFKPNFQFSLDQTEEFLQVQFDFPDYNDVEIEIGKLRNGASKYPSESAKKKLVKESLFSLMVWVGHVLGT